MIAIIALNDTLILAYYTNPTWMNFSERAAVNPCDSHRYRPWL